MEEFELFCPLMDNQRIEQEEFLDSNGEELLENKIMLPHLPLCVCRVKRVDGRRTYEERT